MGVAGVDEVVDGVAVVVVDGVLEELELVVVEPEVEGVVGVVGIPPNQ